MTPRPKPPTHAVTNYTKRDIVVVCAWCPELHIMKLQREMTDTIEVLQHGKDRLVIKRNGMPLAISHGICPGCEERERGTRAAGL